MRSDQNLVAIDLPMRSKHKIGIQSEIDIYHERIEPNRTYNHIICYRQRNIYPHRDRAKQCTEQRRVYLEKRFITHIYFSCSTIGVYYDGIQYHRREAHSNHILRVDIGLHYHRLDQNSLDVEGHRAYQQHTSKQTQEEERYEARRREANRVEQRKKGAYQVKIR